MKLLLMLFFLVLLSIVVNAAINDIAFSETQESSIAPRGTRRFLASMTCDKFPRVCRLKSSKGPDCCKKKCVNVKTDRLNCGMCGYKCKYTEICCKGKCVNSSFDNRHCGGCNVRGKKGELCVFGMCNYAWSSIYILYNMSCKKKLKIGCCFAYQKPS